MEIDTKIADWQRRFEEVVAGQAKTAGELRSIPTDELHQRSLSYTSELAAIRSEIEGTLVELPNGRAINCGEYQVLVELVRLNGVEESLVLGRVAKVSGGRATRINLSDLGLIDITPLAGLTALQWLSLARNQLADISPLAGLTALRELSLNHNQLTDITPLGGLTALQWLHLNHNQLTDITPLAGLAALESLQLAHNQLTDITPLAGLAGLGWLHLNHNQLTDITPLTGFPALGWLYLNNNQLTDISPLAGLTALGWLFLTDNPLTDSSRGIVETIKSRGVTTDV